MTISFNEHLGKTNINDITPQTEVQPISLNYTKESLGQLCSFNRQQFLCRYHIVTKTTRQPMEECTSKTPAHSTHARTKLQT